MSRFETHHESQAGRAADEEARRWEAGLAAQTARDDEGRAAVVSTFLIGA